MNNNIAKYLLIIFGFIVLYSICSGPKSKTREVYRDVNVQSFVTANEGLDLRAVGELVKKAKNAEQLETLLNSKNEGINNLDLNEDGNVDYISVTEYGKGDSRGFSLTTEPTSGETQEIARIDIEKVSDSQANMEIRGNEQIYGRNHYYHSGFGLTEMLILGYLFRPHSLWSSPWGYGNYPGYYRPYNTMDYDRYRNNTRRYTRGTDFRSSSTSTVRNPATSPNAGKTARSVRAPLKNPTASQKSFQARNPSAQTKSGGFGRSGTRSTSRSSARPSVRRSSSRRSGGYSRGGK